jgi:hypothetical protein
MLKSAERRPVAKALAYLRGNGKVQYGEMIIKLAQAKIKR